MLTIIPPSQPVSSLLAQELAALGERVGAALDHCRDTRELEALEDALQSLAKAKTCLDKVSN